MQTTQRWHRDLQDRKAQTNLDAGAIVQQLRVRRDRATKIECLSWRSPNRTEGRPAMIAGKTAAALSSVVIWHAGSECSKQALEQVCSPE